jgi:hypothetical protein
LGDLMPETVKRPALTDCRAQHEKHPDTFHIPDERDLWSLGTGDFAKLIFTIPEGVDPDGMVGERMWVVIRERAGDDFVGVLDNEPLCFDDLRLGDLIGFSAANIADIMAGDE